jgi:nicotinamide-nucleotide amidase
MSRCQGCFGEFVILLHHRGAYGGSVTLYRAEREYKISAADHPEASGLRRRGKCNFARICNLPWVDCRGIYLQNTDLELAILAARVGRHLLGTARQVATAESCTGGWIVKALTDVAGSSQWVLEGFVTYSNDSKIRRLRVPRAVLKTHGAVSEPVARAMAAGALQQSGAQLAVAVTGIAGPGGAVPGKPVGTVWLAWAVKRGRRVQVAAEVKHFKGDREAVRRKTVRAALLGLLDR